MAKFVEMLVSALNRQDGNEIRRILGDDGSAVAGLLLEALLQEHCLVTLAGTHQLLKAANEGKLAEFRDEHGLEPLDGD